MNRREQMRLVDEGIAILEQLNSGAMSRKAEMSAVDRMLEIVELIGGGSAKPDTSKYDGYIKIAADSVAELRLIDVDRVLEESGLKGDELKAFGDYIIKNRPDLDGFVKDGIAELNAQRDPAQQPKDFTPLLNGIINGDVSAFDDSTKLTELVDAAKESGGDDMPEDKKGLFIEAVKAAGVQVLIGQGFPLAA